MPHLRRNEGVTRKTQFKAEVLPSHRLISTATLASAYLAMGLTLLPSCRFGNQTVPAVNQGPQDPYSGYYLMQPKTMTLYVTLGQETQQKEVGVAQIPRLISQYLTNPVLFLTLDLASGRSAFSDPKNTSSALPVNVMPDGSLTYMGLTKPQVYWTDPKCTSNLEIVENGQLKTPGSLTPPTGFTKSIAGRLKLQIDVIHQFKGDCTQTFADIAACYNDASRCDGQDATENQELRDALVSGYAPWVKAGLLTPETISQIGNYAYSVTYE